MRLDHRRDFIDALLLKVAEYKLGLLPQLLINRRKQTLVAMKEGTAKLLSLWMLGRRGCRTWRGHSSCSWTHMQEGRSTWNRR